MTAIQVFDESIADSMRLRALYNHCVTSLCLPGDYGDLLRMSLIYCMSALDKLVHDLVGTPEKARSIAAQLVSAIESR